MKKIFLVLFGAAAICFCSNAQSKTGFINTAEVISLMSDRDSAIVKLQAYQNDLAETMQGMEDEYNTKYTEYNRKQGEWSAVVRESKERDLQELVQRIQQFQQSAQQELQQMQNTLMAPVVEKAQKAIEKVAKANGLAYVFDLSSGALIYFDEAQGVNLLPLVKKELGIPASKVAPTQIGEPQAAASQK